MNGSSREILSVSFINDMPRAYFFEFHNQTLMRGPYAESVKHFAHYRNFDLRFEVFNDVPSVHSIYNDIYFGEFHMSTYSTTYEAPPKFIAYSYPVEKMNKCVMVPFSQEIPRYLYIIWPFGPYIWICLISGIIYIALLMRFVALASSTQNVARSIIRNIPHALNISLYTNNMGLNIKHAPVRVIIFYTLLYLYGFILSAYHLPYMTSFCMKPLFMKPIDTVQDILNAKLQIIVKTSALKELENSNDEKWPILEPLMENVTGMYYQSLLRDFNRDYAYVVSLDQWDFINREQKQLKKPIFHLSEVCFTAALRSFPIQTNWIHADKLNVFLMRIREAGLWKQWIEAAFLGAVSNGDAEILLDSHPVVALNLEFFIIAWIVLIIGVAVSFVVIILEYYIWVYQLKKRYLDQSDDVFECT